MVVVVAICAWHYTDCLIREETEGRRGGAAFDGLRSGRRQLCCGGHWPASVCRGARVIGVMEVKQGNERALGCAARDCTVVRPDLDVMDGDHMVCIDMRRRL